jgi:predicted phosphodiesterase
MRVAALYDIHGNLPALQAVLAEVLELGVDRVIIGGDTVPGPLPYETVEAVLDLPTPVDFVHGNGEIDVLTLHRGEDLVRVPTGFQHVVRWVTGRLAAEHLSAFAAWPRNVTLDIAELGPVHFCHATPRDDNEIFTAATPDERLRRIFDPCDARLFVCGHTHMQFDRMVGDVRIVNAGSVGMPFGPTGAHWALIGPSVELRRTDYDLEAADRRLRATDYPDPPGFDILHPPAAADMVKMFEHGR